MSARLPETIESRTLSRVGRIMEGVLGLGQMGRLASLLHSSNGSVTIRLVFDTDEHGINYIQGEASAELEMICQRCMQPTVIHVEADILLGIVGSETQAENLPEPYEPLVLTSPKVVLADVIEDELILALPVVAMHSPDECSALQEMSDTSVDDMGQDSEPADEKPNPFAVLETLKKGNSKQEN